MLVLDRCILHLQWCTLLVDNILLLDTALFMDRVWSGLLSALPTLIFPDLVGKVLLLCLNLRVYIEESRHLLKVVEAQTWELLLQLLQQIRLLLLNRVVFAGEIRQLRHVRDVRKRRDLVV